eukprot:CAMPEP_0197050136 /NCGR_PEP_ID=MMETSP1384-20130603/25103_1 /TAXON_ID=29189 /ORGANISM="Ammonia sp." /LENGTH=192 /DNA_ID=CAMNT_0042482503 /DNA_START=53 /DNA_END=631 /DNA_ORIENTATION=-
MASDFEKKIFRNELIIFKESDANQVIGKYSDFKDILRELESRGLGYEKWNALDNHTKMSDEEVLKYYQKEIDVLMKRFQFKKRDILSVSPDNPKKSELRQKFLDEHTHGDDEVRYFVDGAAAFYIHLEDRNEVLRMECAKGHLLIVPKLTKHWFDMGADPDFKVIRFFGIDDGWVAEYTKDTIASRFPLYSN